MLICAYSIASLLFCVLRGIRGAKRMAGAFVSVVAVISGLASLLAYLRPFGLHLHMPLSEGLIVAATLLIILLPSLGPRWLAWRERLALLAQAEKHAAERTLLEARLAALQGQIEPHFLFNTLANVQYLLRRDVTGADSMLSHLITYLRATLPELRQKEAALGQELARVRAYLDIMTIRMGDRLAYRIECLPTLEALPIPPLSLATLVENALKHGLEAKPGGGSIVIRAERIGDTLQVAVEDDGVGFNEASTGGGIGLRNLRERLSTQFGDCASLTLAARDSGGVAACLMLPINSKMDS
jgi:sensor histidine kinase YesM